MEWVSGNVFIRPMGDREGLKPGQVVTGHVHNFDHTSIFFCGRWRVRKWVPVVREDGSLVDPDGANGEWAMLVDFEREGPFHLLIEAHARHEFTFLGPGVGKAWCVYSHRTPQGEVSEHYTGWWEAYR
jgi:hypothetical protein